MVYGNFQVYDENVEPDWVCIKLDKALLEVIWY